MTTTASAGREIGGNIYQAADGTYFISDVVVGGESSVSIPFKKSSPTDKFIGQFHTHSDLMLGYFYSPADTKLGDSFGLQYLITPSGQVRVFDPLTGEVRNL